MVPNSRGTFFLIGLVLKLNDAKWIKKCAWISKLNKFEKNAPSVRNQIISCESSSQRKFAWSSKFTPLSFKIQAAHFFDSNNIVEVQTPGALFCRYAPRYISRLKSFDSVSHMGTLPFVICFSIPQIKSWFFNRAF